MAAFEELVHRYEHRIYAFVMQYCHNDADAHEITQDAFVRAFQAIGRFVPRGGFGPWLFTIARRKCIDRYRATVRVAADDPLPEVPDQDDPSVLLARQEERQQLWALARKCLGETQFQALWLRYAEDMSVAEIARVLSKTTVHVKVLLFRARQALGRELKVGRVPGLPAGPLPCRGASGPRHATIRRWTGSSAEPGDTRPRG